MKNTQCVKIPDQYAPYTIEIELTNYCNAHCIFCPNNSSKRERGFIDKQKLYEFLNKQKETKKQSGLLWTQKRQKAEEITKLFITN